jgi:Zn-dependent alcohol dehydrogenase
MDLLRSAAEDGGRFVIGAVVKAVRFDRSGGVNVLEVVDVPRPEPGPGEVLVAVKAAGINPGEATAAPWDQARASSL